MAQYIHDMSSTYTELIFYWCRNINFNGYKFVDSNCFGFIRYVCPQIIVDYWYFGTDKKYISTTNLWNTSYLSWKRNFEIN